MRTIAAIFDLDRTFVGPAEPHVARMVRRAELVDGPVTLGWPGSFATLAHVWAGGPRARHAASRAQGWSVAAVAAAAAEAAEAAVATSPEATHLAALVDAHRSRGMVTVLVSSAPEPFIAPLARAVGFDEVLATPWEVEDGRFTGGLAGDVLVGHAKVRAIRDWMRAHRAHRRSSYAYVDAYPDAAVLAEVGHPVAVEPDLAMRNLATLRGWETRPLDAPPGVIKVGGRELQDWLRPFSRPELFPYARFDIAGVEHVPASGPAILVFNHRSYFDAMVVNLVVAASGRRARFLGKREVFDAPVVGTFARAVGGIRVDRASGSSEPLERAAEALRAGELITIAPQGTIPRGPAFFEPRLRGRWGAARLAAMSGAPVVPLGLWGTERVWPRNARTPNIVPGPDRPLVRARVGPPVEGLTGDDPDRDTTLILDAVSELLPPEAREHRQPTADELAATYPPGYGGDPTLEADRRPGTDTTLEVRPT
ncbi:MAG: HAD-IB family phosphatase [Actinomycetota bacterium]|nr:HAD-IB family phosphatase [Actinomycetota bacterium]